MSTSKVVIITCGALLLLTMFPVIAGRHVPAPPPPASSTETSTPQVVKDVPPSTKAPALRLHDTQFQGPAQHTETKQVGTDDVKSWRETTTIASNSESIYGHRLLVGSSPPTCQGKCGNCNPCNPIHVSIGNPHGALTQQEYYPEVWRCKCGNKLFMP